MPPLLLYALPLLILALALLLSLQPLAQPFPFSAHALDSGASTALLLTAHPDDESMFFAPTIIGLVREGWEVRVLCLSVGNAEGLGEVRREELKSALRVMGVPASRITVVDDPALPDSMTQAWPAPSVLTHLSAHLASHPASLLLTFDTLGVSHHANHASLPLALLSSPTSLPPTYVLRSSPLLQKFTSVLGLALPLSPRETTHARYALDIRGYATAISAMREHTSQLLWFRYLYLLSSRYMWVNEWAPLSSPSLPSLPPR